MARMPTAWFEELLARVPEVSGALVAPSSPTIPNYVRRAVSHLPSDLLATVPFSDVLWCMAEDEKDAHLKGQAERHRLRLVSGERASRVDEDCLTRAIIARCAKAHVRLYERKRCLLIEHADRSIHIVLDQ